MFLSKLTLDIKFTLTCFFVFFKDLQGQTIENPAVAKLVDLYPRVLITPHMGSYTDEAVLNMIETSFENIKEYEETGQCKFDIQG